MNIELIYNKIKNFATNSPELGGRCKFQPNFDQIDTVRDFPYMSVQVLNSRLIPNNYNWFAYVEDIIEVTVIDKLLSSKENELQVTSDCNEILWALIADFSDETSLWITDVRVRSRYQQDDSIVGKSVAEITFRYDWRYNKCNVPN